MNVDARTLTDILQQLSDNSLSVRFDAFWPILEEKLKEPKFKEKKELIPIESGLKIPFPRLG